jgi:amidophosphoribosyltransferase
LCGILGITGIDHVVEELYTGLIALQHRGQDAAGIITFSDNFHVVKDSGLVQNVFDSASLDKLKGSSGIAHVRYSTVGEGDPNDAQPFKKTLPFAASMCHNGNVTNYTALREDSVYMDTKCDVEAILNIFMHGVYRQFPVDHVLKVIPEEAVFNAVGRVLDKVEGSYAVLSYVPKVGMLAFRDVYGIKPLEIGMKETKDGPAYCFSSETVALDALGYDYMGSVGPGEGVIVTKDRKLVRKQVREPKAFSPCIFELIYFARPSSIIEGVSVSGFRYQLGKVLAERARMLQCADGSCSLLDGIDIVTDVPSTATRGALAFAESFGLKYRPMFDKNNYIGRSFIESSDVERERAAILKFAVDMGLLNDMSGRVKRGIRMVKIDDSFVRGITNRIVNEYLRSTGMVERIVDGSLSPRIEWPCPYGIDMQIKQEFVARGRTDEGVAKEIRADLALYTTLEMLSSVANKFGRHSYCEACFSGNYPTGITDEDLKRIERERVAAKNCGCSGGC